MTETEMYLIGDLLYRLGNQLAVFDERTDDKRLLIVTSDAPTIARYVIASPIAPPAKGACRGQPAKVHAGGQFGKRCATNSL